MGRPNAPRSAPKDVVFALLLALRLGAESLVALGLAAAVHAHEEERGRVRRVGQLEAGAAVALWADAARRIGGRFRGRFGRSERDRKEVGGRSGGDR